MKFRDLAALTVIAILLSSCAGMLFSTAAGEFDKGMALFNQGQFEEAAAHFQKATELDPEYGRAYLYLGRSYLSLKQWTKAIQPLRTAFRLAPDESRKEMLNMLLDALIGAGISEFKKGNFSGSLDYLKEGLSLEPDSSRIKNELIRSLLGYGNQLLSEGRSGDAVNIYSEAAELSPGNRDVLVGLAKAFLKDGNFLKAVQTIQKARGTIPGENDLDPLMKEILEGK